MISAERFAQVSGSYWKSLFPKMENFVRFSNGGASQYAEGIELLSDPNRHIVISETAFVLWRRHLEGQEEDLDSAFTEASSRLSVVWDQGDFSQKLEEGEAVEVTRILSNMAAIEGHLGLSDIRVEPHLPGCGVVSGGSPDFYGRLLGATRDLTVIGEFKTVNRSFRSVDYRQVVVYLVLHWAATRELLDLLWLANPLRGTLVPIDVDSFFWLTRSQGADEAVAELANEWASPGVSS